MTFFRGLFEWLFAERGHDWGLLILRLTGGGFMLTHGWAKIQNFAQLSQGFADPFGLGAKGSLILILFAEFFCSILVVLGLCARLAVVPLIIGMIVAAFFTFPQFEFGQSELALLYLFIYIALFFMGSGHFSADRLLAQWLLK